MYIMPVNFPCITNGNSLYKPQKPKINIAQPINTGCDVVSFGRMIAKDEIMARIGRANFPCEEILNEFEAHAKDAKELFFIHHERYSPLLECKTIKEVKKKFPEFSQITEPKDADLKRIKNLRAAKLLDGLDIKDFPLEILKYHYGKINAISDREKFYGLGRFAVLRLMREFNIREMDGVYFRYVKFNSPEHRLQISQGLNTPETKEKISKALREAWAGNNERREKQRRWCNEVMRSDEATKKRLAVYATPEYRQRQSDVHKKLFMDNPVYAESMSEANAYFPEYKELREKIAKEFPTLQLILEKRKKHIPLTESEQNTYGAFHRRVYEECPDMSKNIMAKYHEILVEKGVVQ